MRVRDVLVLWVAGLWGCSTPNMTVPNSAGASGGAHLRTSAGTGSPATTTSSSGGGSTGSTTGGGCSCPACPAAQPLCLCTAFGPPGGNGVCGTCQSDSQCPSGRFCETNVHSSAMFGTCVSCTAGKGCAATQVCVPGFDTCVADCRQNSGATCTADINHCDTDSGLCVRCLSNADCGGLVCRDGQCQACATNADCVPDSGTPICGGESLCVQCLVNADCPSGLTCNFGRQCQ